MDPRHSASVGQTKKQRRSLTVSQKLHIISRLDKGERSKDVCAAMKLSSSTVRSVYLQKEKLKSAAGGVKQKHLRRSRDALMKKLERLLIHWIDSHNQRNLTLSFADIQKKAVSLFDDLKVKAEEEGEIGMRNFEFKASKGWFERFKKCASVHNLRTSGKKAREIWKAAKAFPNELQKIIEEGGYSPKQIFNVTDTGLFWKRMPSRTSISIDEGREPGFKESKDRLTLLLGGNLEGDVKLKPLLVYHSQNPQALKGLNKAALPVIWRSNKKAWVTKTVFADYVTSYLSPFITEYCSQNNVENKALVVIDNAPGHPVNIEDYADNIRVVFLPPHTASILQPMDQGIIAAFNAYYLQLVMKYLITGSVGECKPTVKELWKDYDIKIAIENVSAAWNKLTPKMMNGVWRTLLPKCVHDLQRFDNVVEGIQHEIVKLAVEVGFEEVNQSDVQVMLASHSEKLTNDELIQLDEEPAIEDCDDDGNETMRTLDANNFCLLFATCEKAIKIVEDNDPQMERSCTFKRKLNQAIECYRELYAARKRASISYGSSSV